MGTFSGQLKQVLRRLRHAPVYTTIAILTLALGIGANTAIFSVLENVLLKPLPYPQPEQLIGLWHTAPGIKIKDLNMSPSLYFTYADNNRTFQKAGVYTGDTANIIGHGEPEQVKTLDVTSGVLPALGVRPFLGRTFSPKDDSPGTPETVMLSYGYWQRRFGSDRSIIGRRLQIDGKAKEVIGVLPRGFHFLDLDPALLTPLQFDRNKTTLGNFSYNGVARLRPGVTIEQADADAARMLPIANRSFQPPPGFSVKLFEQARIAPTFRPFKQDLTGDIGAVLWVLMSTIGIVLLIACANVANLLLVRTEGRHMELTIRAALGASWGRIAAELLSESVTLALLGGACGLALAFGALRLLVAIAPAGIPRLDEIGIDAPVLLFAAVISLLTGVLFGCVPVFKYAGTRLGTGLREAGRTSSHSRERHRARNTLVIVQVALAVVLLISSGLMIRTFRALIGVHPGFSDPAHIQTLSIAIPEAQVPEAQKVLRMEEEILGRLRGVPGVSSVSITSSIPMGDSTSNDVLFARDHTYRDGELPGLRNMIFDSPELSRTLGTPLIAGRDFTWSETDNAAPVAVVSENLAREQWGSVEAALHKQVREGMNDPWREIVGVVGDVYSNGVDKKAPTTIYFPLLLKNFWGEKELIRRNPTFVIRSPRAGSQSFLGDVRQAIWSINPNLPLAHVSTLDEIYRKSMARTSFALVMLMIAAAMALVLGAVGIYGVIAYSVSQRTREIGLRMALGAQHGQVSGMFVRHGIRLTALGALFGFAVAFAGMRLLKSLLFSVSPIDPITYIVVFFVLLAIAAFASYLPSRRAVAIDPAIALRLE